MKTLDSQTNTLKNATWKKTVLLVKWEWNDGGATIDYYSERVITVGGQAYTEFVKDISVRRSRVQSDARPRIDDCTLTLDNTKTIGTTTRWADKIASIGAPEKAEVTISIYFDDSVDPKTVEVGRFYCNSVEYNDETVTVDLVELSTKLYKPLGLRATRTTFASVSDKDEGAIAPIVYGNAKRVPGICIQCGANSKLFGEINSSVTTVIVHPLFDDGISIPSSGTGIIDDEKISWTGTSTNANGSINLTTVTRGASSTTAAAHSDAAAFAVIPAGGWKYVVAGHRTKAINDVFFQDGTLLNTSDFTKSTNNTTDWSAETVSTVVFTNPPRRVQLEGTPGDASAPDTDVTNNTATKIKLALPGLEQNVHVVPNAFASGNNKGMGDVLPNGSGTGSGNSWDKYYAFAIDSDANIVDSGAYAAADLSIQGAATISTTGNLSATIDFGGSTSTPALNNSSASYTRTQYHQSTDNPFVAFSNAGSTGGKSTTITVYKTSTTADADVLISGYEFQIKYQKSSGDTDEETITTTHTLDPLTVYEMNAGTLYIDVDGMTAAHDGSTLITNPTLIKRDILTNTQAGLLGLTDATYIDDTSFDVNETLLSSDSIVFNFALTGEQKKPLGLIADLDFWSRSRTYMDAGKWYSKYIPLTTVFVDKNLTTTDVRAELRGADLKTSFLLARTSHDLVMNKLNLHFKPRYVTFEDDKPRKVSSYGESATYNDTDGTLGSSDEEITLFCPYITTTAVANAIGGFLVDWRKNVRRVIQFESGIQNIELEPTDTITVTYPDFSLTNGTAFFVSSVGFGFGRAVPVAEPDTMMIQAEEVVGATIEDANRTIHWFLEGSAIDEEAVEGPATGITHMITGGMISARTAPTGADLTVDVTLDGAEQSNLLTLTDASTSEQTIFSTPVLFTSAQKVGIKLKSIGSTQAGKDLNVHLYYKALG